MSTNHDEPIILLPEDDPKPVPAEKSNPKVDHNQSATSIYSYAWVLVPIKTIENQRPASNYTSITYDPLHHQKKPPQ